MKALIDFIGMTATCFAFAIVFCGLQCYILFTYLYESVVGTDS